MSSRPELKLDWCDAKAMRFACEKWHYSKCTPVNKLAKVGVWEGGSFRGVIVFGVGASAVVHRQFSVSRFEVCELVRVALATHIHEVSKMIAISIRLLKRQSPRIRVIVSFSDPSESHHGGIYQAGNWAYTGDSSPTKEFFFNGRWRHVTDVYKRLDTKVVKSLPVRTKQGKHRYVMPLDDEMRRQIEPLRKPYPKRAGSVDSGTPGDQPGRGGAIPTSALSTRQE